MVPFCFTRILPLLKYSLLILHHAKNFKKGFADACIAHTQANTIC